MYLYVYELRYDKWKVPFCELYFISYIFPHAFNKREDLNKGFVIAAIAMFPKQIGVTISLSLLCFPWSKKEVDRKCCSYSLILPASPTPGQEVKRSTLQSLCRNCFSAMLLPTSVFPTALKALAWFNQSVSMFSLKWNMGMQHTILFWCVKLIFKLLLWWKPYHFGILTLTCSHS